MNNLLFVLILCATALGELTCESGKVYAKFTKQCQNWGYEESFEVYSNGALIYTSPDFVNYELRETEICLDGSTNNQYTIKMKDTYGDSWSNGAYLQVEGINGNIVFKNYMTESREEEYTISLYYGANKNDSWKLTSNTVTGTWTDHNYDDTLWSQVTLGSVTVPVSGTQYFRKVFTGLSNMAAYELGMNYKYGVVAYITSAEIYRDNMPEGAVTSTTPASGSYSTLEYRSIIRPGVEISNAQSVLAIELHFPNGVTQTTVDFNAYLSLIAPSISEGNCFIYPYNATMTNTDITSVTKLFDFYKFNGFSVSGSALPVTIGMGLDGAKAYINSLRVFPNTSPTSTINSFTFEGTNTPTGTWTTIFTASNLVYESKVHQSVAGYFSSRLFSNYRMQLTGSPTTSTSYLYELQPMICGIGIPTAIDFDQTTYTFYAKFDNVEVTPIVTEFTNCQITPTPMAGLTFDSTTCTLSGKVSTAGSATYTVTSTMNDQTYTGSFSLSITTCAGSMVNIQRVYTTSATNEGFSVVDAATQQAVLTVTSNSGQINNAVVDNIVCLTGQKYIITTTSTIAYWQSLSFLYVYGILDEGVYETMLRVKYDTNLGLPTTYTVNVLYNVNIMEEWKYQMGTVPTNWYSTDMSSWTQGATYGNFPVSSNQIQLYKKQFTVNSIQDVAGVVISLRYQYGVLIYLNGHEAFRLGVTGELLTTTMATTSLSEVAWRQVSLPIKTMVVENTPAVDYIVQGTNTIAIALVAASASSVTSTFDCAIRLMGTESVSRFFDTTTTYNSISGSPTSIQNFYYGYTMYYSSCKDNYWQITFNNDRHEWISSIAIRLYYTQNTQQPRQFILKAKNAADTEWTTLKTVTGMTWSQTGQRNRIWVLNNKSYNQYRLENIGTGISTSCYWKLSQIDFISDATTVSVPALTYEATTIYKDIEMAEVYPNSEYYYDFTISPSLPAGISLDPNSGMISGTATEFMNPTTYTISAKKYNGEAVTAPFSLSVELCFNGKNLITLVARTDYSPAQSSYKVYQGKGKGGTVVRQIAQFMASSALNYGDFCLNHGIYTLEVCDTYTGWNNPAGFYLTIDLGALKFDMNHVYSSTSPTSITTMFSSYLPFQIEYDDWKVYKDTTAVAENWNTVAFDDAAWTSMKAADIGTSEAVTVYIRHDITLDDVSNYHVLNVRIKYAGGVVAYFNGHKVARFNLEENFDSTTESIALHDSTAFSVFHTILPTVGAVTGKNVMAFEIHRPQGQSSAEPIVFDATGIFGVNDCSIALDSVTDITSSTTYTIGAVENFFDLTPVTYGYIKNSVGSYLQWSVENLEGTKFNSFAMQTIYSRTNFGFSLYGRENPADETEEPLSLFADVNLSTVYMGRSAWDVPVGAAGFRQFRWEIDDTPSSAIYASAYLLQYCKPTGGNSCPGVDEYPTVGEGQISPAKCPYGFRGYSYRTCTNGALGEVQTDKCTHKLPENLLYESDRYILVLNTVINVPAPTYDNIIQEFYLGENTFLPEGLTLDPVTGAISGTPTAEASLKSYTIYGKNPTGAAFTVLNLSVRKGECKAEGNFPKTQVNEVAEYDCALQGSYVGTQKRACILGARDGEWQKIQGVCIAMVTIVILVVIVIVVIAIIVFFITRTTKKTKAVGGVKGKKNAKTAAGSAKTANKKPSTKAVKV